MDALYVMLDGGKKEGLVPELREAGFKFNDLNLSMLAMERRIENTGDMAGARELMRGLVPDLDADVLAKIYGAVCKGRGNTVKVYRLYAVLCGNASRHVGIAGANGLAGRCLSLDMRR